MLHLEDVGEKLLEKICLTVTLYRQRTLVEDGFFLVYLD